MIKSWRKKATAIAALCLLGVLAISYRDRNPSLRAKKVATQTSRMDMKDANQDGLNIESDMIPHHIKSCAIDDDLVVSAIVETQIYSELRTGWFSLIDKIMFAAGSIVKKGDLIASVDTKELNRTIGIYEGYQLIYGNQLKSLAKDIASKQERRKRLEGLAAKGIIPETDLDQLDKDILGRLTNREQVLRSMKNIVDQLEDLRKQVKSANFFSPIDGIVTKVIADPKSISGRIAAMNSALVARIDSPGRYIAKANFLDVQAKSVFEHMNAAVKLPDGSIYPGKVTLVSPVAVQPESNQGGDQARSTPDQNSAPRASGSYLVTVEFSRPGQILPPLLLAEVRVIQAPVKVKQCVPWNALTVNDGTANLRLYSDKSGWISQNVELGRRGQYDVEILTPLPSEALVLLKLW
jgi:multidrug efflux pump subunit AcrA (membrane-fusion protein)